MSRTLFFYVLKDLVKIFIMASGVLAGIMSFGGLLKPLTEYGLSASQAAQMLACFMPATQTYALPIAALFATTMVYGRLAADNELTACRASGISNLSLTMPAVVMGLVLAIVSLLCLCFVAPLFMLKAERVVFSNIAEVVKKKIDRSHQVQIGGYTIYANSANLGEVAGGSEDQIVLLNGVVFVKYASEAAARRFDPPKEFWISDEATAFIRRDGDDIHFTATLKDGMKVDAIGAAAAMHKGEFGPIDVPSPIREKTQFMDIRTLKDLSINLHKSRKVREVFDRLLKREAENQYLQMVAKSLNGSSREYKFETEEGNFVLSRGDVPIPVPTDSLRLPRKIPTGAQSAPPQILLTTLQRETSDSRIDRAQSALVRVEAVSAPNVPPDERRFRVEIQMQDVSHQMLNASPDGGGDYTVKKESYPVYFNVPMPKNLQGIQSWSIDEYKKNVRKTRPRELKDLKRAEEDVEAHIKTEIQGRASFAVSCLILVMVGCALGMLFKSGDFLTAFGISVVPALVTIALVSTGQHLGENNINAIRTSIALIWSGNVGVLILAVCLLWKLQRQ